MLRRSKRAGHETLQVCADRVKAIASAPAAAEYRSVGKSGKRTPRQPVYKQAVAVLSHGEQLPVVVRNLSPTGCRIEFFKQVQPSGRIRLTEPSLPLDEMADVIWNAEGACGLAFENSDAVAERLEAIAPPPPVEPVAVHVAPRKTRSRIRKR